MANYDNDARPPNGTRVRYMASDRPDIPKGICGVITHQDSSNAPYFDFDNGEKHRCVYIRDCEPESDSKTPIVDATRYSPIDRPKTGTKIVYLGNPEKGKNSYNHSDESAIEIGETGVVTNQDNSINPKIKMDTLDTGNGRFRDIRHFGELKSATVIDEHPQRFAKNYDIPIGTRVRYIGHSDTGRNTSVSMNDVGVVRNRYVSSEEIFRIQWDKSGNLLAYTDTLEPEILIEKEIITMVAKTQAETIVAAVPGARADNLSVIANSLLSLTVREMNSLIRHMKAISDLPLDGVDLSNVLLEAADRLLGIEPVIEPEIVVEQSF